MKKNQEHLWLFMIDHEQSLEVFCVNFCKLSAIIYRVSVSQVVIEIYIPDIQLIYCTVSATNGLLMETKCQRFYKYIDIIFWPLKTYQPPSL